MYRTLYAIALVVLSAALAGCMNKTLPPQPESTGDLRDDFAKAISQGDEAAVTELLGTQPLLLNEPHPTGNQYPLHVAATAGNASMVKLLLEQGANPNVQNDEGEFPVDRARMAGAGQDVIDLLQSGQQPAAQ